MPTATANLAVLYPDRFTVNDIRVCDALGDLHRLGSRRWSKRSWVEYGRFIAAVRSAVPGRLSLRDADRWLWGQNKRRAIRRNSALTERSIATPLGPSLLGVDVGYSKTGKSTGMAWRVNGRIGVCRTGSGWSARAAALPPGVAFDLAAFDAPLVPVGPDIPRRGCEAVFYRGAFIKRCRPGMSHFGQGLAFRQAGALAAEQFQPAIRSEHRPSSAAVAEVAVAEAFPSAFLGVLLPDRVISGLPFKRGGKSDRLYEACLTEGVFEQLVADLGWPVGETVALLAAERDHDRRAAYICLLTAGLAHAQTAIVVGDSVGGWFWLPPLHLWADWARAAVSLAIAHARKRGYPDVAMAPAGSVA